MEGEGEGRAIAFRTQCGRSRARRCGASPAFRARPDRWDQALRAGPRRPLGAGDAGADVRSRRVRRGTRPSAARACSGWRPRGPSTRSRRRRDERRRIVSCPTCMTLRASDDLRSHRGRRLRGARRRAAAAARRRPGSIRPLTRPTSVATTASTSTRRRPSWTGRLGPPRCWFRSSPAANDADRAAHPPRGLPAQPLGPDRLSRRQGRPHRRLAVRGRVAGGRGGDRPRPAARAPARLPRRLLCPARATW